MKNYFSKNHKKFITLKNDLRTASNSLIAAGGSLFDDHLIEVVLEKPHKVKMADLWREPFKTDSQRVIDESNYKIVFEDRKDRNIVPEILSEIKLPLTVFEELNNMKTYDFYTYRHIFMTTSLTIAVSRRLGKSKKDIISLAQSALTHDFGKIRIPIEILKSSKKLKKSQYEYIYQHPIMGYLLLLHYYSSETFMSEVSLKHHEYPNKSGYPLAITQSNENIGIITVNDIFDALISPRSYRKEPFNIRGALDLIWDGVKSGKIFEKPAKCIISINRKDKPKLDGMIVHEEKRGYVPSQSNYGPSDDE